MNATTNTGEMDRIRKAYDSRDTAMPFDQPGKNIYHPRHPLGRLLHEHNRECLTDALNTLDIDLRGLKILDVGCGYGYWLRFLIEIGAAPANLYGIDLSHHRIDVARTMNPGVNWINHDGGPIPFPDQTFDIVIQSVVFSSIKDDTTRSNTASEMARVTRAGGYVFWIDLRRSKADHVRSFCMKDVELYFPCCELIYSRPVHPRYFRMLAGKLSWLGRLVYHFSKAGCESWFLVMRKVHPHGIV